MTAPAIRTTLLDAPKPLRAIRAAVIGLGKMGVAHTAVLATIPDVELVGLSDHHAPLGRSVRGLGHKAPFFDNPARLIDKTRPEAVFICTQPDAHRKLAEMALEAGAAIFVEKPLANTLSEAEAIAAAVERHGKPGACGYNLAFVPIFAAAHHVLRTGVLGQVQQTRASMYLSQTFGPRKGWMYDLARSGGGVVTNVSSHLLFLLQWMLGTPVDARAEGSWFFGEVEDEVHAMMRLQNGAEIGFDSSWSVPGYPYSAVVIEFEGRNGKMLVSNDGLELELATPQGDWPAGLTQLREADLPQPARFDVNGESYYLQDAAFLHWATGGVEPPNTVAAALEVQRMIDAIYRSARDHGATVPVKP
ncbi:MAG TPA: Gfo/Idh/MocA family oxidoreductase [Candidatus Eisenbacteria bacterium]|nr:Gfo/Idh/MocA family oxidoreductase [Candidatus Eisenbacteria bacterium]